MRRLDGGEAQGGADRARARHGDRGGAAAAFRDHDLAPRRRDLRPPRARRLHRRLGGRCGAARLHHERALPRRRRQRLRSRRRARRSRAPAACASSAIADTRIREDVLRLLRFYRFHAHYGAGEADAAARAACRALRQLLPTLSGERVAAELLKLLAAPDPLPSLALMSEDGVLAALLPEARARPSRGAAAARARARSAAPSRRAGRRRSRRRLPSACVFPTSSASGSRRWRRRPGRSISPPTSARSAARSIVSAPRSIAISCCCAPPRAAQRDRLPALLAFAAHGSRRSFR